MALSPPTERSMSLVVFVVACSVATILHELGHVGCARCLGYRAHLKGARCVVAPGISAKPTATALVHHCGWIISVTLAAVATVLALPQAVLAALWLTAAEAVSSDLVMRHCAAADHFHCGNFGLLLFDVTSKKLVIPVLRTMLRVTMMRGAQSAGVVTYVRRKKVMHGVRSRVVNGKRTDL